MEKIIKKIINLIKNQEIYNLLMKVGAILLASAAIALGQMAPDLYSNDIEAHKLKFETEFQTKILINNKTDCSKTGNHEASCKLAVHQMEALESSIGLLDKWMKAALILGAMILLVGILGLIASKWNES